MGTTPLHQGSFRIQKSTEKRVERRRVPGTSARRPQSQTANRESKTSLLHPILTLAFKETKGHTTKRTGAGVAGFMRTRRTTGESRSQQKRSTGATKSETPPQQGRRGEEIERGYEWYRGEDLPFVGSHTAARNQTNFAKGSL